MTVETNNREGGWGGSVEAGGADKDVEIDSAAALQGNSGGGDALDALFDEIDIVFAEGFEIAGPRGQPATADGETGKKMVGDFGLLGKSFSHPCGIYVMKDFLKLGPSLSIAVNGVPICFDEFAEPLVLNWIRHVLGIVVGGD